MEGILSLNSIKEIFSSLGAKTSDSNYAVALLDKTSAEPKGMMDFANLASVLGAYQRNGTIADIDNNDMNCGMYYVNGVMAGTCPINRAAMYGGALFVIPRLDNKRVVQIYFRPGDGGYYRLYYEDHWEAWFKFSV